MRYTRNSSKSTFHALTDTRGFPPEPNVAALLRAKYGLVLTLPQSGRGGGHEQRHAEDFVNGEHVYSKVAISQVGGTDHRFLWSVGPEKHSGVDRRQKPIVCPTAQRPESSG